jgi:hypothetical protein
MRGRFLLGMLSGGLIAFGLSLIVWFVLFQVLSHHMFIIGIRSPSGYIMCATPALFVMAGVVIGFRALKR